MQSSDPILFGLSQEHSRGQAVRAPILKSETGRWGPVSVS